MLGSRTGALFRSKYFYATMGEYSERDFASMQPWERFTECYRILQTQPKLGKSDKEAILMESLKEQHFSKADMCLTELVQNGTFRVIITSNADDLLYEAFSAQRMNARQDFVECVLTGALMERKVHEIVYGPKLDACKVIHTCRDEQTLLYNMDEASEQVILGNGVKDVLSGLRIQSLLMVGIDPVWDEALLLALPARLQTIWNVSEDRQVSQHLEEQCRRISNLEIFEIGGNSGEYSSFMLSLHHSLFNEVPKYYDVVMEFMHQAKSLQQDIASVKERLSDLDGKMDNIIKMQEALQRSIRKENK